MDVLGLRTHPDLIKILKDESVRAKLTVPTRSDGTPFPEAPINRICELFERRPPPESVGLLSPYLNDRSKQIQESVALVIGSTGTPETVEPLRKALSDSDEYVRASALIGLKRAVKAKRLDEICKRDLFSDLEQLISAEKNTGDAANLLLDFDSKRAGEFCLSAAILNSSPKSLYSVLDALADHKIAVPRERLLSLIAEFDGKKLAYAQARALGAALHLLGQHQQPEDRLLLEARMTSAAEPVAIGAAEGLLASHGLEGFEKRVWDEEEANGFSALSVPKKYFSAVRAFDGEVCGEGLSSYFYYSDADQWKEALAGFQAMGFKERTAILREAIAKFGRQGPPVDSKARQRLLDSLAEKDEGLFEELGERYYKSSEIIEVFAARYVIKNADAFK